MAKTLAPVGSLLLGIAFLLAGNGLQATVLPLRAALDGFSTIEIGIMGSGYYAGFVVGCLAAPFFILRAGHIRAFTTMVSVASAVALIHPLSVEPVVWILCRAITGFCLAGIYLIVESWLNDRATNTNRGFILSAYIGVNFSAITVGQLLVMTATPAGFSLFALASILASLAVVPVAMTRSAQPAPITIVRFRPSALYRAAPVALIGCFLIGVTNGAFWALGPIFGSGRGLDANDVAVFMSAAVVGGALLIWPTGRLSDRIDRRVVLLATLALSAVASVLLVLPTPGTGILLVMAVLFGATTLTGYSLAAAHAYDRVAPDSYVETAAGVLLANGAGSIVGPLAASSLMGWLGPGALFGFVAAIQVALGVYVALRLRSRVPTPTEEKTGFDVFSTAPVGAVMTPGPLQTDDPLVAVPDPIPPPEPGGESAGEAVPEVEVPGAGETSGTADNPDEPRLPGLGDELR